MSAQATRCDGCERMRYDTERVGLLVAGQIRAERDLCAACRSVAIDVFLLACDGMPLPRVHA